MRMVLSDGTPVEYYPVDGDSRGTVLIFPGGGYIWLSPREAAPVAHAFNRGGWDCAVLEYSCKTDERPLGKRPLLQAVEALELLKRREPGKRVLLCGFSAGGHLAACLGVHWPELTKQAPDGLILGYPVITTGKYTHGPSIENLTGHDADAEYFSCELHVGAHVPPAFVWHTASDETVPVQNSLLFVNALLDAHVPVEFHMYPRGVHGLSLATAEVEEPEKDRYADEHIATWMQLCLSWLDKQFPC